MLCSRTAISVGLLFSLGVTGPAYADSCPLTAGWSFDGAASYLAQDRSVQTAECTAAALQLLASPGAAPDPALLVGYIGFLRPGLNGMILVDVENVGDLYPAIKALVRVGQRSLPALIGLVKEPSAELHVRMNAARTVKLIHPDAPAVAIEKLYLAAGKEKGAAKQMLEEAAAWLHAWCSDAERADCQVAYDRHTNP